VAVVGTGVLWIRFNDVDAPATQSVALLPTDLRFVVGARYLVPPLLLALGTYVVLWLLRDPGTEEARNATGTTPRGLVPLLTVIALVGVVTMAFATRLSTGSRFALVGICAAFVLVTWLVVRRLSGFGRGGWGLFVCVAAFAGVYALVLAFGRPERLDLAVVLRTDQSAIGGYYVAKAGDAVYLLTLSQPGGASNNVVDVDQPGALPQQPPKCSDENLARQIAIKDSCYVVEVVEVPAGQVAKLSFGPRDIPVDRNGYRAARTLAQVALRREDEERLPHALPQEAPR
jgi:uncharacterized membrane protein YhaH (DUF805 family)